MALTLHAHPLSSYCWKVLIAFYESGTPFEFRHLDFADETQAARFRALWPIARMPVLEDGDRTIVESSVIIEHLTLCYPGPTRLVPADPVAALPIRMLDRIFDNYVMGPVQTIVFDRIGPAQDRNPAGVEQAFALLETSCGWLEVELAGRHWALGDDFSLADCAAAPALFYANEVRPAAIQSGLAAYLDRLKGRPSIARVLEEAKPWRHLFPTE